MNLVATGVVARAVELTRDGVRVRLDGGQAVELHRLALRDGCLCTSCRHPVSGQRLFESGEALRDARIAAVSFEDGVLSVGWVDGHASRFPSQWLAAEADAVLRGRRAPESIGLWGAELASGLPSFAYAELGDESGVLARWLAAIVHYGFAVLTGAPTDDGTVAEVAELFGFVRTTNYGRVFDVSVRAEAINLADTARGLSLHTDNPYRFPTPTLQLLQCLASSVSGGESVLADGFRAVALLARDDPGALALLSSTPVRYSYRDASSELVADVPVVSLEPDGSPLALHLNNRSKGVPVGPPELVGAWYEAYLELVALLEHDDAKVVFRLDPGDVLVLDNLRVLHGRTGFSGAGARRLQGCYADRDALRSTLAVLGRGSA